MLVVPSILDAVTVHAEGALCTRIATLQLVEDRVPTEIQLNGLPMSLRPGTLRAAVRQGPPGLSIRAIRPTFDVQLPPEVDVPGEHRALEEALARVSDVVARLEGVQRELQSIGKLKPTFAPQKKDAYVPHEAPLAALLALTSFVDTELTSLNARRLELEQAHRDAEADVRLRRQRLHEASSSVRGERARVYRAAVLTLSGNPWPRETPALISLEYAVPGARWVPTYDLRLPRTLEEGTLRMRASIIQRTGEDWTGVKLAVSTAALDRKAEVPELKALRIGRRQPPPPRSGWREPPPGLDELFAGYDTLRQAASPQSAPRDEPVSGGLYDSSGVELEEPGERERSKEAAPKGGRALPKPMPPKKRSVGSASASAPPPPPAPAAAPRNMAPGSRGGSTQAGEFESLRRSRGSVAPAEMDDEQLDMPQDAEEEGGSSRVYADMADGSLGGGGAQDRPSAVPRLEPSDSLLDYDRLSLTPADDLDGRGRLRPRPSHVTREILALSAVQIQVNILSFVAVSEQEVNSLWRVPTPTWTVPPRESAMHFDARFDLETRADVPSDAAWHTLPVLSVPVGLSAEYVCVPSVESRAFRTVRVENRTPYPLLAGPVDVTLGDEFLMTSPLPTMPPGSTQRLGLGVEESIKVARNTRFDEATGGIFGGATMLTHHVSVELANRMSNRILVEVCERVPAVPTGFEKDIKVEETEVAPVWQKRTPLPGEVPVEGERAWRVVLQPGEAQTLKATWTVKIPASKMLGGGNRRT
ncbi:MULTISPECIES: DUF4139 domain-containing protein [unclassified Myxococcus]|uniref:DUF4139 domain-containing protein n=1 Tax=unclassified Myxococcus TaxID=2648731 RepID=UPI00157B68EF|nr:MULTISPECIES: DUF4139 domain-containing protein [unclassified Myxococcus]NTX38915.1 DUF4139 domain-containing protein [Myxococcus sp. CA033]NTX55456.1 DUF4139 domain-containing protein [Myxococcus sp. CA039A]